MHAETRKATPECVRSSIVLPALTGEERPSIPHICKRSQASAAANQGCSFVISPAELEGGHALFLCCMTSVLVNMCELGCGCASCLSSSCLLHPA